MSSVSPVTASTENSAAGTLLVVVLADRRGRLDAAWLSQLRTALDGARFLAAPELAARHGIEALEFDRTRCWTARAILPSEVDAGVLAVRSGLELPVRLVERLGSLALDPHCPEVTLLPGNHHPDLNPLAGLDVDAGAQVLDSWMAGAGQGHWTAWPLEPVDVCFLRPPRASDQDSEPSAGVIDTLFVFDPSRPLSFGQARLPRTRAAFGVLRERLQAFAQHDAGRLPFYGQDSVPVTLHVTHAWGGGIARWIDDQCRFDRRGHHLVLMAEGLRDDNEHGHCLVLRAGGCRGPVLDRWVLTPSIASTAVRHRQYQRILRALIGRHGVARVVVSSLIGHSLDCLRTGLPTAQILHDFYPGSPLLHIDPLLDLDVEGRFDLAQAMAREGLSALFAKTPVEHWSALREGWAESIQSQVVRLIAPTRHVAGRWQHLFSDVIGEIAVVNHGFNPPQDWPSRVVPKKRSDQRLSLVVIGRLTAGKGLDLLCAALDEGLGRHAHVTVIGAGQQADGLFGRAGVDVILDYAPENLPELLTRVGPDAVLFLSTVPETWNYVLSEVRRLRLTPLATRLGAFCERIRHGLDGLLFAPEAAALVSTAAAWRDRRDELHGLAEQAPVEPSVVEAAEAYWRHLPPRPGRLALANRPPVRLADLGERAWRAAELGAQLAHLKDVQAALVEDLEKRTDWALRQERLAGERTDWARALEQDLLRERDQHSRARDELLEQLDSERRRRAELDELVQESNHRLTAAQQELQRAADDQRQLSRRIDEVEQRWQSERQRVGELEAERTLIMASRSWRLTRPLRVVARLARQIIEQRALNPLRWPGLLKRLRHGLQVHGLRHTVHLLQGTRARPAEPVALPPLDLAGQSPAREHRQPVCFDPVDDPLVSVVVPVYNNLAYTVACLHSLFEHAAGQALEVVVIDDASSDGTADYLARCQGIRVLSNAQNLGYLRSCNLAAQASRGDYLVFLNNDTTVTSGWLEALLKTFETFTGAGIVGGRLIYPDGRLQEAGGIVFADGHGWNYGREDDPRRPQYGFAAECDYVSGACLAIRRELFERLGAYDELYAPAYYEDTDLCFRARQAGWRVICQPACTVVHHEGVSSGTDETQGVKRYQAVNREKFVQRWAEVLAAQPAHAIDSERSDPVRAARFHRAAGRVLVIDATTPMPDHDSGSMRMSAILELLAEQNWLVTFVPENLSWSGTYSARLQRRGIEVLASPQVANIESWLIEYGADLDMVLVSRYYVARPLLATLRRYCPRARIVFDTVDLHFLREQRKAELEGSRAAAAAARRTQRAELDMMRGSDLTLVVSPVEKYLLEDLLPNADIRVLSNIHTVQGCRRDWAERRDLLFVGGFQHPPNVDAAEWLIDEIVPLIRQRLPELRLHLIGSRMPDALYQRAGNGVEVHGFVEDLSAYLDGCRVSLAPLRYGAGVKGKVNQAMAWGIPVVATSCAAEGMFLSPERDVLIGDSAALFADQVVRVYQDQALWQRLSEGGLVNVETHFSRAAAARVIESLVAG